MTYIGMKLKFIFKGLKSKGVDVNGGVPKTPYNSGGCRYNSLTL